VICAAAGEGVVETAISKALSDGRAPTKSEILQAAREIKGHTAEQKKEKRAERERIGAKAARSKESPAIADRAICATPLGEVCRRGSRRLYFSWN
jgi:hypothetical protein